MTEKIPKQSAPLADATRYKTRDVLGAGGMKVVVRAEDLHAGRDVAMAISKVSSERNYRRFLEEARITASLEHPNIIPVHEVGHTPAGTPFFTMKIVHGDTLEQIVEKLNSGDPEFRKRYTLRELLEIFCKICDAIAFAHSKGIIHLDLKPANILVGDYGEVLVLDWGIAHRLNTADSLPEDAPGELDSSGNTDMTMDGVVKGTPEYMAPEQAAGLNSARTRRTDIYGLGAILYYLLTWSKPFDGDSAEAVMENVMKGNLIPPHEAGVPHQKIPQALEFVIYKAMARDPEHRYSSVSLLKDDVLAFLNGFATKAEEAGFFTNALLWINRKKHAVFMSAAIFLLLTITGSILTMHFYLRRRGIDDFSYKARQAAEETIAGLQKQIVRETSRVWNLKFEDTFSDSYLFERWEFRKASSAPLSRADAQKIARFRDGTGLHIVADANPLKMFFLGKVEGGETRLRMNLSWNKNGRGSMILAGLNTGTIDRGYLFAVIPGDDARVAVMRGDSGEILQEQRINFPKGKSGEFDMSVFQDSGKMILSMSYNGEEMIHIRESGSAVVSSKNLYPCILSFADSEITLENLKLMTLGTPIKADLLDIAERLLRKGSFEGARQLYNEVLDSSSDADRRSKALQGVRKVSIYEKFHKNFPDIQQKLRNAWKNQNVGIELEPDGIALSGSGKVFADLAPLSEFPLASLSLENVENLNLRPIISRKINRIELKNCTLADPSLLARMDVQELVLQSVPLNNPPKLNSRRLKQLVMKNCGLRSLGFLRDIRPDSLDVSINAVSDLSPLDGMMPEYLNIAENHVISLAPLAKMRPKTLIAFSNRIQDISPLKNMPLEMLDLSFNKIESLAPLSSLSKLQSLKLIRNEVSSLEPLANMDSLRHLYLDHNRISSLEPLKKCTFMRNLSFPGNRVTSLEPLESMRQLRSLDCSFNPVESAEPVGHLPLRKFYAAGTNIGSFDKYFIHPPKQFIFIDSKTNISEIDRLRNELQRKQGVSTEVLRSLMIVSAWKTGQKDVLRKYSISLRDGRRAIMIPVLVSCQEAAKSAKQFGASLPSWKTLREKNVLIHSLTPPFWMDRESRIYGYPVRENGIFAGRSLEIKLPLVLIWK